MREQILLLGKWGYQFASLGYNRFENYECDVGLKPAIE